MNINWWMRVVGRRVGELFKRRVERHSELFPHGRRCHRFENFPHPPPKGGGREDSRIVFLLWNTLKTFSASTTGGGKPPKEANLANFTGKKSNFKTGGVDGFLRSSFLQLVVHKRLEMLRPLAQPWGALKKIFRGSVFLSPVEKGLSGGGGTGPLQ